MATSLGTGGQSPTSLSRPIERVFDDAQHTGEIKLNGRKLKEFPKIASKYDLVDTILADLSKNRFGEIPKEVCDYLSMEKLICYNNVMKSIPEALIQLQALTYINLSRNQLSVLPPFISQLQSLEVLIASNNKLVSLPEEMGVLDKLMELDVSCNEISQLPVTIGDLKSLKSLNIRRNFLVELPVDISKLNLRKLDFSCNRISKIPTVFRKIETLEEIILDHNPLTLPPAHVCTKGRQHILKYLQIEAIREDKKRGILNEVEMKRYRKSLPPQQSISSEEFRNLMDSPENRWKRHTVLSSDSGYSTTDSLEKCGWSSEELQRQKQEYERKKKVAEQLRLQQQEDIERDERRRAAMRVQEEQRAVLERQREDARAQEEFRLQEEARQREAEAHRQEELRRLEEAKRLEEAHQQKNKKPALSSSGSFKEERKATNNTQYRRTVSDSTRRVQQANSTANSQLPSPASPEVITNGPYEENTNGYSPATTPVTSTEPSPNTSFSSQNSVPPHSAPPTRTPPTVRRPLTTQGTTAAARRTKVSDRLSSASSTGSTRSTGSADPRYGRATTTSTTSRTSGLQAPKKNHLTNRSGSTSSEEDKKRPTPTRTTLTPASSTTSLRKPGTGMSKTSASTSKPTPKVSKTPTASTTSKTAGLSKPTPTSSLSKLNQNPSSARTRRPAAGTGVSNATMKILEEYKDHNPNFTINRQQDRQREEQEQIEMLRKTIETRLKRSLPDNLPEALSDGVLLCHLANQIRPRSVASVHVPSPAVPKLTMAKCRRNVDNFLEACRKIGVRREQICCSSDILEEKGISRITNTVAALVAIAKSPRPSAV